MPAALSRTELMERVLAAVPGERDYLAPHHDRFHVAYSLLREHLPAGLQRAVDVGASRGIFLPALDALGLAELHAVDFGERPSSRPLSLRVGERTIAATHHELD